MHDLIPVFPDRSYLQISILLPYRAHRLRSLGNAIVPQIAAVIGHAIMRFEQSGDH